MPRDTLVVHDHELIKRGFELATLAEQLEVGDIGLEFLTGKPQGP
ncbi:hypothetical protein [Nocardia asteroides]|uniref:Uncharacterized protein n=1 Tax=Nocardia asteroides NBRC 15531 TaxID=1110697 RepID=U5ED67_NOCAS|nr:hypothetical protein [Nocardia asteroides]GAD85275.1 hypothetical protein NCAST_30_00450 [Nocardia asteroides NBRC 15531]SFN02641.1 hypothetical protein SAMN05444423_105405 [Nocardia asteroides]VEG35177.1 Uncharacterised protein [Nocardia asteroides]